MLYGPQNASLLLRRKKLNNVSYIKHSSFIVDFLKIFLHNVKGLTSSGLKHLELNRFLLLKKIKKHLQ